MTAHARLNPMSRKAKGERFNNTPAIRGKAQQAFTSVRTTIAPLAIPNPCSPVGGHRGHCRKGIGMDVRTTSKQVKETEAGGKEE